MQAFVFDEAQTGPLQLEDVFRKWDGHLWRCRIDSAVHRLLVSLVLTRQSKSVTLTNVIS